MDPSAEKPILLPTQHLSPPEKRLVYTGYFCLQANDRALQALRLGDVVLLGLRKMTKTTANKGRGRYDDRLAVFSWAKKRRARVEEFFHVCTEPTAQYDAAFAGSRDIEYRRSVGQDINKDGLNDLGRVCEGSYEMQAATHYFNRQQPKSFALRPTKETVAAHPESVERDTNHDGCFDERDENRIDRMNSSFKIHIGSRGSTDSAGCTTVRSDDYARFIKAVTANRDQSLWHYVIVEVR